MAARDAPRPVRTFLVVMAAVTLGLIVTGIRVQDAVFSERSSAPSTAPKPAVGTSGITVSWTAMNSSDAHRRDAQVLVQYAPPVKASQK